MVATSEAHDSGLCAAGAATKRRFASDLLNLTLAAPAVNRHRKSGKDAGEWMPGMNRCWFAGRVVAVKRKYGLSVDGREARALEGVLSGCRSTKMVMAEGHGQVARPTPSAAAPSTGDALRPSLHGVEKTAHRLLGVWTVRERQGLRRGADGENRMGNAPRAHPRAALAGKESTPALRGPEGQNNSVSIQPRLRTPRALRVGAGRSAPQQRGEAA